MERFRWTDLTSIVAVLAAVIGYGRTSYDQGKLEGIFDQRMKQVEESVIDAKASARIVPSVQGDISGLKQEVAGLREDYREQNKKWEDMFKEFYKRGGKLARE